MNVIIISFKITREFIETFLTKAISIKLNLQQFVVRVKSRIKWRVEIGED